MLGSGFEAEDAVQETFVRAWRGYDRFEGRAALRSWLHPHRDERLPVDAEGPPAPGAADGPGGRLDGGDGQARHAARGHVDRAHPDSRVVPEDGDPAEVAEAETIRLAFLATLQKLPPKQRAVLILREVLHWHADEVGLLETSVASVNSALQRARATIAAAEPDETDTAEPSDAQQEALLARYVETFERYDVQSLVALLHEDATMCMPPYSLWLRGLEDIAAWHVGPGAPCRGSRLVPVRGQRLLGRAVPAERAERRARAVGAAGRRDPGRRASWGSTRSWTSSGCSALRLAGHAARELTARIA